MHAVNMPQPHLNDMEEIYRHAVEKGIALLAFSREHAEEALRAGRELRRKGALLVIFIAIGVGSG